MAKDTTSNDTSFYPEDAQERNFKDARETAQRNHDAELDNQVTPVFGDDKVVETTPTEAINPVAVTKTVVETEETKKKAE